MSRVALLVSVMACTSYRNVDVTPESSAPPGVGLTAWFDVTEDQCDPGPTGGCFPGTPSSLSVATGSDASVTPGGVSIQPDRASFALTGVAIGSSEIDVTADGGASTPFAVTVGDVAATTLFATRNIGTSQVGFSDVYSPVQVFTESSVSLGQTSVGASGDARAGIAPLHVAPATDGIAIDSDTGEVVAGTEPSSGTVLAGAGSIEIDVVELAAIADFTIGESPGTVVQIGDTFDARTLDLIPTDSAGRPIVGIGQPPSATVADESILTVVGTAASGNVQTLQLFSGAAGTTTLDLRWGAVHKTYAVTVTQRGV